MIKILLILQVKKLLRSFSKEKKMIEKGLLLLLMIWYGVMLLALGLLGPASIHKMYPDQNLIYASNQFLLYFLLVDLIIRILFMPPFTLDIKEIVMIPIPKKNIINGILTLSLGWVYNLFCVLFLFLFLRAVSRLDSLQPPELWGLMVFFLLVFNHFFALWVRQITSSFKTLILITSCTILFVLLNYFKVLQFNAIAIAIFNFGTRHPSSIIGLLVLCFLLYRVNFWQLRKNLYLK